MRTHVSGLERIAVQTTSPAGAPPPLLPKIFVRSVPMCAPHDYRPPNNRRLAFKSSESGPRRLRAHNPMGFQCCLSVGLRAAC